MDKPLAIVPTEFEKGDNRSFITFLETLSGLIDAKLDVIVVDNGSEDAKILDLVAKACKKYGISAFFKPRNSSLADTINVGLNRAIREERDAVIVSPAIKFSDDGWLDALQANGSDIVGAKLLYPNEHTIQHAGIYYSILHREFNNIYRFAPSDLPEAFYPRHCPVTWQLQYIKNHTLSTIGVYDETFLGSYADIDYCVVAHQNGLVVSYEPTATAIIHESMLAQHKRMQDHKDNASQLSIYKKHKTLPFGDFVPLMV